MNQQTLQKIYKNSIPETYFSKFFNQLKIREDSRQFQQIRDIKITIKNNTVAISRGQTIIICQIKTHVQKVIFNAIQNSFGKPLLNLNVTSPNIKIYSNRQAKPSFSIQEFVNNKIQWNQIQSQLSFKQIGNRYFAHTGQIQIRIVSSDGNLNQTCLLAVQLLLWSNKFQKIDSQSGSIKNQLYLLQIPYFLYPCKYCQIMNQLLVDPTKSQQQNCSYNITIIGDLLSNKIQQDYYLIQKINKNFDKIPEQIITAIISMWKVQMSKLSFDIKGLQRKINLNYQEQKNQVIDLLIRQ